MKNIIALLAFTLTIMSCEKIELYDENNNIEAKIVETEYFKMVETPEYPGDVDYDSYNKLPLNPNTRISNEVIVFDSNEGFPDDYIAEDYYHVHGGVTFLRLFVVNDDFETLDARFEFGTRRTDNKRYSIYIKKGYNYATAFELYGTPSIAIGTIKLPFSIKSPSELTPVNGIFWTRTKEALTNYYADVRHFTHVINENLLQTGLFYGDNTVTSWVYFKETGLVSDLSFRTWKAQPAGEYLTIDYYRGSIDDPGDITTGDIAHIRSVLKKQSNGFYRPHETFNSSNYTSWKPYHPFSHYFDHDVTDQDWEIYDGRTLKYSNEEEVIITREDLQELYGYTGGTPPIR